MIRTPGVPENVALIPKKLDLRLTWNYSQATGKIRTFNPVTPAGGTATQNAAPRPFDFPDIKDRLHQVEAALRYQINQRWFATLRYVLEKFDITDFCTDNIQPFMGAVEAGSGTSIYLGAQIRDYTAHILALTVGFRF